MAKKLDKDDENDLEILHPERQLTLRGQEVTVREYTFVESLKHRPIMQAFITDLHALATSGSRLPLDEIFDLIASHMDEVLAMVAIAADIDRKFLDSLSSAEGDLLLMAWWGANGPFFTRQLQARLLSNRVQAHNSKSAGSAGETSTQT